MWYWPCVFWLALLTVAAHAETNVTVDDSATDVVSYLPTGSWRHWTTATGLVPDSCFNDTVSNVQNGATNASISFTFKGVALYYFGTSQTDTGICNITIDGQQHLIDTKSSSQTTLYNQLLFQVANLSDVQHQVTLSQVFDAASNKSSLFELDRFIYTTTATQSTPTPAPAETTLNIGIIVGGVISGLVVLIGAGFGFWWLRRRELRPSTPYARSVAERGESASRAVTPATRTGSTPRPLSPQTPTTTRTPASSTSRGLYPAPSSAASSQPLSPRIAVQGVDDMDDAGSSGVPEDSQARSVGGSIRQAPSDAGGNAASTISGSARDTLQSPPDSPGYSTSSQLFHPFSSRYTDRYGNSSSLSPTSSPSLLPASSRPISFAFTDSHESSTSSYRQLLPAELSPTAAFGYPPTSVPSQNQYHRPRRSFSGSLYEPPPAYEKEPPSASQSGSQRRPLPRVPIVEKPLATRGGS